MDLKHALKTGTSFGLTSGIITTLGVMVGLHSTTRSKLAVAGGIIIIAVADAFSDALGIHISEESEAKHSAGEIWLATLSTLLSKTVVAALFIVPIILFSIQTAIYLSGGLGLIILAVLSSYLASQQGTSRLKAIAEHLTVAVIVIILSHYLGLLAANLFK
jgi:vacuolar iron transporter family protein